MTTGNARIPSRASAPCGTHPPTAQILGCSSELGAPLSRRRAAESSTPSRSSLEDELG